MYSQIKTGGFSHFSSENTAWGLTGLFFSLGLSLQGKKLFNDVAEIHTTFASLL
jgi:hypothetical protein